MLVIRHAKIFTAADKTYERGDIAVENGKIIAVAEKLPVPDYAEIIEADGLFAMPGIVDAHSHVGGFGAGDSQDLNEMTCNATPAVESFYAIDSDSKDFPRIIRAGITTSVIAPGSGNVIGGMVCACKSVGVPPQKCALRIQWR